MRFRLALLAVPLAVLTGCGVGIVESSSSPTAMKFEGSVHGGEAPIIYSKVSFYETATTGVATNGVYVPATPTTELGSAFTDLNGYFSFPTPLHCQNSNDFVYAVAAGGDPGSFGGFVNANSLEMAAVGSCASFGGSTFVVLNEVSSVAAAYALSGFMSITGSYTTMYGSPLPGGPPASNTNNSAVVRVGAPNSFAPGQPVMITNCNRASGTAPYGLYLVQTADSASFTIINQASAGSRLLAIECVVQPTVVTSVPVVSVTSSATNFAASGAGTSTSAAGLNHAFANAEKLAHLGLANKTVGGNPNTVLPMTMLNGLANVLQACVNSSGGYALSPTVNNGTACGKLFSYTTDVSGASQVVPTNTLQATLNMAHFPTQNVGAILGLASGMPAFAPTLTGASKDLSLGILYNAGFDGIASPQDAVLGANDDVYVANINLSSGVKTNAISFSNAGAPLWSSAPLTGGYGGMSLDSFGNLFLSAGQYAPDTVREYLAATGDFEQTAYSATGAFFVSPAFDAAGDLFLPIQNNGAFSATLLQRTGSGAGTFPVSSAAYVAGYPPVTGRMQVAANGTAFFVGTTSGKPVLLGLPYTGTGSSFYTASVVAAAGSNTSGGVSAVTLDSTGLVWTADANTLVPYTPSYTSGKVTGFTQGGAIAIEAASNANGSAYMGALTMDGARQLWAADSGTGALLRYNAGATNAAAISLVPCVANTQGSCGVSLQFPGTVAIDAAGSVWETDYGTGAILEVIGSAAPTWPLPAVQKPGVMP